MATDLYVDGQLQTPGLLASSFVTLGKELVVLAVTYEKTAADNDTSVLRMFKSVPGNLVPISGQLVSDAITGCTDVDLGIYKTNGGAVLDADALIDGRTLASAVALGANTAGFTGLDVSKVGKKIYELAGHTAQQALGGYDIALTLNTGGTATGTISLVLVCARA